MLGINIALFYEKKLTKKTGYYFHSQLDFINRLKEKKIKKLIIKKTKYITKIVIRRIISKRKFNAEKYLSMRRAS